ncbi:MAG: DUF169 domain-containing protein [Candidatus Eisenbacteria bacterium]|jgi:hypothetical protein|nr:DUF169 domain-containing protein [Candidatus Eisenbacteria bacterium]
MDPTISQRFAEGWKRYFPGSELPIAYWYSDSVDPATQAPHATGHRCIICDLARVRRGDVIAFDKTAVACGGGKRYLGFSSELHPRFEHFLSCGIPGKLEGERYKKSPRLVREMMKEQAAFEAPGRYIIFAPWDLLRGPDQPEVVVFFATCDVLAGLFTLANYDRVDPHGVIAPMGSGCSSIVQHPRRELASDEPRAVLGMFDVSARPCVAGSELTFAVPWPLFTRMVANMDESFLITPSWTKVRDRISRHLECELR